MDRVPNPNDSRINAPQNSAAGENEAEDSTRNSLNQYQPSAQRQQEIMQRLDAIAREEMEIEQARASILERESRRGRNEQSQWPQIGPDLIGENRQREHSALASLSSFRGIHSNVAGIRSTSQRSMAGWGTARSTTLPMLAGQQHSSIPYYQRLSGNAQQPLSLPGARGGDNAAASGMPRYSLSPVSSLGPPAQLQLGRPVADDRMEGPGEETKKADNSAPSTTRADHRESPTKRLLETKSTKSEPESEAEEAQRESKNADKAKSKKETFPQKLHRLLEEAEEKEFSDVISWQPSGKAFILHKPREFTAKLMPQYLSGSQKMNSFIKQLNLYGFKRIGKGPENGSYFHQDFIKGRPDLCLKIRRSLSKSTRIGSASSSVNADQSDQETASTSPNLDQLAERIHMIRQGCQQPNETSYDHEFSKKSDSTSNS